MRILYFLLLTKIKIFSWVIKFLFVRESFYMYEKGE